MCMSVGGPQYPLLTRLSAALSRLSPKPDSQISLFKLKVDDLIAKRESSATRSLSDMSNDSGYTRMVIQDRGVLDVKELCDELPHDDFGVEVLVEAIRRLEKETRAGGDAVSNEKGVRQL